MYYRRLLIIFMIMMLINTMLDLFKVENIGKDLATGKLIDEAMQDVDYTEIIHILDVKNDKIIFYINIKDEDVFWGNAYLKKVPDGYRSVSHQSGFTAINKGEFSFYSATPFTDEEEKTPFSILYGKIESQVKEIEITDIENDKRYQAHIVNKGDFNFWYVFTNQIDNKAVFRIDVLKINGEKEKYYKETNNMSILNKIAAGLNKTIKKVVFIVKTILIIIFIAFLWWILAKWQQYFKVYY